MPQIIEKDFTTDVTNITLVTTAETVIITSPPVKIPVATCRVLVKAWAQLTTGGSTTAVTPRIRRGTLVTDPLVGEANPISITSAAGGTDEYQIEVSEAFQNRENAQYVLTLQQTAAAANGSVLQAGIEVEVLNG